MRASRLFFVAMIGSGAGCEGRIMNVEANLLVGDGGVEDAQSAVQADTGAVESRRDGSVEAGNGAEAGIPDANGGSPDGSSSAAFSVLPPSVGVRVGGQVSFVVNPTQAADWTVEGSNCGSITSSGVYTAPSAAATCMVRATSRTAPNPTSQATVTVRQAVAGTWEDITPPVPKPWADTSQFYFGWDWIDGAKPGARGTLYASIDHGDGNQYSGVWKTTNGGDTWARTPSQGPNNELTRTGAQPLVVDFTDSNIVYAGSIKTGLGLFKSTNGGASWGTKSIIPNGIEPDVYWMSMDPSNHLHLLLTFHSAGQNWAASGNAGVLESFDGGATWPGVHQSGGWTGAGQFVFFIGGRNDGSADTSGTHWLVTTQGSGLWRTENSGQSWTRVADFDMTHGMAQLYRAPNRALYLGSIGKIFRSTDNGRTWADTGAQTSGDGYGGIIGDDTNIWTMLGNTGFAVQGPHRWQTLPITDTTSSPSASKWTFFGSTQYENGPAHMLYDPENRVLYASTWGVGIMRMKL